MRCKKTILTSLLTTAAFISLPSLAEQPSYTYVEAGGFRMNFDDLDINPTGYYIAGSAKLGESLFVRGTYGQGDDDLNGIDVDITDMRVGLGFVQNIDNQSSWYVVADYLEPEVEAVGISIDENGYDIAAGIRNNIHDNFELFGEIGYADVDDADGFIGNLGVVYTFVGGLGVTAKAEMDEDKNSTLSAGVRYSF